MFNSFNPEKTSEKISNFLKKETRERGFTKVINALSGGIDSTVVTYLAVKALQPINVLITTLPYKNLNDQGLQDAQEVITKLNIPKTNVFHINIGSICDRFFANDPKIDDLRKGNIMARVRMTILYDLAKKERALVLGAENKSEHLLSYFTRYGDEAADLDPIRDLYKTEVRILAKYLGVPKEIREIAPTAGLWQKQTDEGQLGFTYKEADQILYLLFEKSKSPPEIIQAGYQKEVVEKVHRWVKTNDFKHHLPIVCKLKNL